MEWLEVHIDTNHAGLEPLEIFLSANGVDGVVIDDEQDFQSFLENNHQYWDYVDEDLEASMKGKSRITFYLPADGDGFDQLAHLRTALQGFKDAHAGKYGTLLMTLENLKDADWENNWKQYYKPMEIGERLLVIPEWEQENVKGQAKYAGKVPLILEPGLTFGTGSHATTRLCLTALEEAVHGGETVLDLGCGYGWHCIYAAEHGAASVTGVDLSEKMLAVAREKATAPQVTYIRGDMAETPFPPESFDVVLSSLAIHYLPSFTDFLERVRQCLSPGGDFVFSVEHPIFTAAGPQEWYYGPDGTPLHFPVDRYFEEGRRTARFLGEDVTKYHRTLTTYLDGLLTGGFQLLRVVEPQPPARMLGQPGMRDELRRPMMLLVSARKRTAWPHGKPGRRDGPG